MKYAVYRCLYGEDFIQESINSISPYVDKVFVFWTNKVWGNATKCTYKGKEIIFPDKFDSVVNKIKAIKNDKIVLIEQNPQLMGLRSEPWNMFTLIVNNYLLKKYPKPDMIIFPEVDHVFKDDQLKGALWEFKSNNFKVAKVRQVELWRTPKYRIPERSYRTGTVFWNFKNMDFLPRTHAGGEVPGIPVLNNHVHNFGFAVSEKIMFWKHMTAIAFSKTIGDSVPNEKWYDDVWRTWDYNNNNKNLEISKGCESMISHAFPYEPTHLPKSIREKYNL